MEEPSSWALSSPGRPGDSGPTRPLCREGLAWGTGVSQAQDICKHGCLLSSGRGWRLRWTIWWWQRLVTHWLICSRATVMERRPIQAWATQDGGDTGPLSAHRPHRLWIRDGPPHQGRCSRPRAGLGLLLKRTLPSPAHSNISGPRRGSRCSAVKEDWRGCCLASWAPVQCSPWRPCGLAELLSALFLFSSRSKMTVNMYTFF